MQFNMSDENEKNMEKRPVTQEDLDNDSSLGEAGVAVGDEHEFEVVEDGDGEGNGDGAVEGDGEGENGGGEGEGNGEGSNE